jgi:hypothetical protein
MMAITTSSSINVNAPSRDLVGMKTAVMTTSRERRRETLSERPA